MAAGFDYDKCVSLTSSMKNIKSSIETLFTELIDYVDTNLPNSYSGEASTSFNTSLSTYSENVSIALGDIITQFMEQTDQSESDYKAEDAKNADSTSTVIPE